MDMTYFWKKNGTIYHSHLECSEVPIYVRTDPEWEVSEQRPSAKDPCRECREKDFAKKMKVKV